MALRCGAVVLTAVMIAMMVAYLVTLVFAGYEEDAPLSAGSGKSMTRSHSGWETVTCGTGLSVSGGWSIDVGLFGYTEHSGSSPALVEFRTGCTAFQQSGDTQCNSSAQAGLNAGVSCLFGGILVILGVLEFCFWFFCLHGKKTTCCKSLNAAHVLSSVGGSAMPAIMGVLWWRFGGGHGFTLTNHTSGCTAPIVFTIGKRLIHLSIAAAGILVLGILFGCIVKKWAKEDFLREAEERMQAERALQQEGPTWTQPRGNPQSARGQSRVPQRSPQSRKNTPAPKLNAEPDLEMEEF
mmetsp:Transcript_23952/g.26587  ORF Transcript_23952/g.26587 Transcript_23952/m.26587 type:complete len:295 (+) Transcript_23952:33-917(+)|eukprot:CAMPEP_0205824932 /NCGR_PEP_ID=MMETSP0206-20130828/23258_1 /ASSEMBLY_ACC=CAM_ASM_000279 /TAXON_ID=36767 /ORGANISM="Euplotes focardii, Strain TN1" /LENGTH=294 /DNA_ID=CAMNT_0053123519 /DNA_START=33 /DNA_END=917 /DNA_ORIENTATION=+